MAWSSSRAEILRLAGWLAIPAGLLLVLVLETKPPLMCLWTRFFGFPCLGCGMHHAAFQLVRGNIHDAWNANPLIFAVFPLLSYLYLRHVIKLWRRVFPSRLISAD